MFVKEAKGLPEPDAGAILVPEVQITIGTDKGDGEPQSAMTTRGTSGPGSTVWNQNFDFTLEESSEVILLKVVESKIWRRPSILCLSCFGFMLGKSSSLLDVFDNIS